MRGAAQVKNKPNFIEFYEISRLTPRPSVASRRLLRCVEMIKEDGDQMPGIFYLREGVIVRAFLYKTIADEPDYLKLIA